MNVWKLHLIWAFFAVCSWVCWGRVCVSQHPSRTAPRLQEREESPGPAAPDPPPALLSRASALAPPPGPVTTQTPPFESPLLLPVPHRVPGNIRELLESKEKSEHWQAYSQITQLPAGVEKGQYIRQLLRMEEEQIRYNSLFLLLSTKDLDREAILAEHLRSDPSPLVREGAAQWLGNLQSATSTDGLLRSFQSDTPDVQLAAAVALGRLGHPECAFQLLPRLAAGLDDPDGAIRQKTAQQLGSLNLPATIPYLARALRDTSGDVRVRAIQSLSSLNQASVLPLISPLLQDPVKEVADAARALIDDLTPDEGK